MTALLRLTETSKSFGATAALKRVSFDLQSGEVHALVGENGAGKSTLIKIITGALLPDFGHIEVLGAAVESLSPMRSRGLGIAVVYQQPALFPDLSVAENLAFGMEPPSPWRLIRWNQRRRKADELLARVGAKISADAEARSLSMPEQQLVEIARALGQNARMLILDEPTASLSTREVEHLFGVIRNLRAEGVGIIYVSHRLEELQAVADRVTVLRDGSWIATQAMKDVDSAALIRLMVGRDVSAIFPKRIVPIGQERLSVRALCSKTAGVHDLSLHVRAGEILGIAGLMGAGRTEFAEVLFGLHPADAGEIAVDGQTVRIVSPADAIENGIAYVPEDRRNHGVIPEMSVAANATLALLESHLDRSTIASEKMTAGLGSLNFAVEQRLAERMIQDLQIKTPSALASVDTLSGGNQQKVALARWLATDPRVLILDEPTQGIDVGAKSEIHRLMVELAERGLAIIVISSELPELLGMCDRIAVMRGGTITGTLDRIDATAERVMALATLEGGFVEDRA